MSKTFPINKTYFILGTIKCNLKDYTVSFDLRQNFEVKQKCDFETYKSN